MFQPATTALVWAACCLMMAARAVGRGRRIGWWVGMVAAFTLALYSYLFAAFALPAAGVVLLGVLWGWYRERGSRGEGEDGHKVRRNGDRRDDEDPAAGPCAPTDRAHPRHESCRFTILSARNLRSGPPAGL